VVWFETVSAKGDNQGFFVRSRLPFLPVRAEFFSARVRVRCFGGGTSPDRKTGRGFGRAFVHLIRGRGPAKKGRGHISVFGGACGFGLSKGKSTARMNITPSVSATALAKTRVANGVVLLGTAFPILLPHGRKN